MKEACLRRVSPSPLEGTIGSLSSRYLSRRLSQRNKRWRSHGRTTDLDNSRGRAMVFRNGHQIRRLTRASSASQGECVSWWKWSESLKEHRRVSKESVRENRPSFLSQVCHCLIHYVKTAPEVGSRGETPCILGSKMKTQDFYHLKVKLGRERRRQSAGVSSAFGVSRTQACLPHCCSDSLH